MSRGKSATPPQEKTEENIRQEVIGKLGNILYPNNTALKYEDLYPGKEATDLNTQKEWMTAIYNYQIRSNKHNVAISKFTNTGDERNECKPTILNWCLWSLGQDDSPNNVIDVKNSTLYQKLKADILKAMKPEITLNNISNKGSGNKTSNPSNTGTGFQTPP